MNCVLAETTRHIKIHRDGYDDKSAHRKLHFRLFSNKSYRDRSSFMQGAVFHRRARVRAGLAFCSALALASCTGKVGDAESSTGGGPKTGSGGTMSPGSDGGELSIIASASVARRLTRAELDNTVRDLLGDNTAPAAKFLIEDEYRPFDNDYTAQAASGCADRYARGDRRCHRGTRARARRTERRSCPARRPGQATPFASAR